MSPAMKYSLGRIGLFVIVALPVFALVPIDNVWVKLMIAVVISAVLAWFLLRRWRDEYSSQLVAGAQRRRVEKERLHSALSGEDTPGDLPRDGTPPSTSP